MSLANVTPTQALSRLLAAAKQINADECKDERVFHALQGEIGVAEGVLRDYVEPEPVGYVQVYMGGSVGVRSAGLHMLPDGAPVYAAPVAAQPAAAPASVPEGFALVPLEPNDAMQAAGAGAIRFDTTVLNKLWTGNAVFRAMLAAAPLHEAGNSAPIGWISPRLLESLTSHRENAKVPSNWSVHVQAAQRNSEDIPLYLNPQGEK